MELVRKAVAAVVRQDDSSPQLLVFDHPLAGTQLVKGTVERHESPAQAVIRELEEEAGLHADSTSEMIGTWDRLTGSGPNEDGPLERHRWYVHVLPAPAGAQDTWSHRPWGSRAEVGLVFTFRWVPIRAGLPDDLHPLFGPVANMVLDHVVARGRSG